MWETIFFWVFAVGAVLSSLAVVLIPRNPLYNALALILDFFFFAGLYVLLSAHFMAVIQVLVYGGAIMVLFMFIIMLLNIRDSEKMSIKVGFHQVVGVVAAFAFLGLLVGAFQPLLDAEAVDLSRDAYVSEVEKAQEKGDDAPIALETPSAVPGLAIDLNEAALNEKYSAQLQAYAHHEYRPADGYRYEGSQQVFPKYREYDRNVEVVVPAELLPPADPIVANRKPAEFGTVQPLSVLLVNRNVVPFELTAVLLLAAVIGAFIIAKKRL